MPGRLGMATCVTNRTQGPLLLYAELNPAQKHAVQRELQAGKLQRIATGMDTQSQRPDIASVSVHRHGPRALPFIREFAKAPSSWP